MLKKLHFYLILTVLNATTLLDITTISLTPMTPSYFKLFPIFMSNLFKFEQFIVLLSTYLTRLKPNLIKSGIFYMFSKLVHLLLTLCTANAIKSGLLLTDAFLTIELILN